MLREVLIAWLAIILVLLSIMLATRFASYLAVAAKGELPRELLLEVVGLSSARYFVMLMPASALLAIMLSLGRLYSDNEIAAMTGCGLGIGGFYRPLLMVATILAALTASFSLLVGPWAGREADQLVKDSKRLVQYTPFEAQRFKTLPNDRAVFYTSEIDDSGQHMGFVFAEIRDPKGVSEVVSQHGGQSIDPHTGDRYVTLEDGYRYTGTPGTANYDVVKFDHLVMRVSPPVFNYANTQRSLATTQELLGSRDRRDQAELQARIAAPVSVLIIALLAIPLSYLAPRQGRYSKLVLGLCTYLAYQSLLGIGQAGIVKGMVPAELGLWGIHGLAFAAALLLVGRQQGWLRR